MNRKDTMMQKQQGTKKTDDSQPVAKSARVMNKGAYVAYRDGVIGNGETSVLFFHAAWCPICKREDANLANWFSTQADTLLTVFKVDYDSSSELKQRYGVTYQHTFVKIDGKGNMLEKVQGPSQAQLMQLLQQ